MPWRGLCLSQSRGAETGWWKRKPVWGSRDNRKYLRRKFLGVGYRGLSPSEFEPFAGSKFPTRRGKGNMLQGKEQGGGAGPHVCGHWVSVSLGKSLHLSGLYVSICKMGLLITPGQGYREE